jgi:diguanylate cyclase (GGDEF)-like protein/PAS domain S-box-containing protein
MDQGEFERLGLDRHRFEQCPAPLIVVRGSRVVASNSAGGDHLGWMVGSVATPNAGPSVPVGPREPQTLLIALSGPGEGRRTLAGYRAIVGTLAEAACILDRRDTVRAANSAMVELLDMVGEDLVGRRLDDLLDDSQAVNGLGRHVTKRRVARSVRGVIRGRNGTSLCVTATAVPLPGTESWYCLTLARRNLVQLQTDRDERESLLASIIEGSDDAIVSTSLEGTILSWNPAAVTLYGYRRAEALGGPITMLTPPERAPEVAALLARIASGERVSRYETVQVRQDGTLAEVSLSLAPLYDGGQAIAGATFIARDITALKASERELTHLALHDALTQLPNRALLEDRIRQALSRCRRDGHQAAVIFLDVDHFKTINDTAGHRVGDQLLCAIAARLRATLRETDTIGRLGGDEFVVLCENVASDEQVEAVVVHLQKAFADPVTIDGHEIWVSASFGISWATPDASVAELLSQADAAMYEAKERQRGTVVMYSSATRRRLQNRLGMAQALRQAVERHEFVLRYQPIIDLTTGLTLGAEALVRWQHPERGLLEPAAFIPVAEELGLIVSIGEEVLRQAARQAQEWRRQSPNFITAVNVSAHQLAGKTLINAAHEAVADGLDARGLILEVTETALMRDQVSSAAILEELRDLGCGIGIDDFGTGYASLSYLKRLPATAVKIDRSFTAGLPDTHDLSIVMAILAIADTYGLEVVAEGIETPDQALILRELGCAQGQGYLFSRPTEASEITRLLTGMPPAISRTSGA